MENTTRRKILLPVDGSDQALQVVRYVSSMVDPGKTIVVLFYVGSGFPEVYWNLDSNPLYKTKKNDVMEWLADRQVAIGEFKEKALKILDRAGFKTSEISVKTQTTKTVVLKDIIQESYQDYSAIAVGRSGLSRLKDLLIGSMAYKLIARVKHIPTIVIGGKPVSRRILVALDESIEAMRGVSALAALAPDCAAMEITLCHCICTAGRTSTTNPVSLPKRKRNGASTSRTSSSLSWTRPPGASKRPESAPTRSTANFYSPNENPSRK